MHTMRKNESEPGGWKVGIHTPYTGHDNQTTIWRWHTIREFRNFTEAAGMVNYLNGGTGVPKE